MIHEAQRTTLIDGPMDGQLVDASATTFFFADFRTGVAHWYRECDEGHWHYAGWNKLDADGQAKQAFAGDETSPCPLLAAFEGGLDMFLSATLLGGAS